MNSTVIPRPMGLAALLAGLAMLGPFCIDAIFPAFPIIGQQLGASEVTMQQTLSVYLAAYAFMSLLHGPLSDSYGRRPIILAGIVLFILASIGCAISQSIEILLLFRVLQGVTAGTGLIVGRAIVRDCFHGANAQRVMSQITLIFGVAPAIAPIVGGLILGLSSWHMIFWAIALFGTLLGLLCLAILPETHAPERRVKFASRSLLVTYRKMICDAHFLPLAIASTANFGALFLYIAAAPAFVLNLLHLNQQQFAWLFIPAISGMMLGAFISGKLAGRISAIRMVNLGFAIMLIAGLLNVAINIVLTTPRVPWSILPIALGTVGIAITFPTLTLLILDRFPQQRGAASSVQSFISLAFNALLAGVIAVKLADTALHLALGAFSFTCCGFLAWYWYRRIGTRELAEHTSAGITQIVEDESEPLL